jgi:hypothetical protein
MNHHQQKYFKRAIQEYGLRISSNVIWFIDEGIIYFGLEHDGEIVHYLSGTISGNVFVVGYTTQEESLDITGWEYFINKHLELNLVDARH